MPGEAIQRGTLLVWIASGYALAMTAFSLFNYPFSIRAPREWIMING
ncbi:MAG: hypothetical protein LBT00_00075 [Spirochaetaceae bacterium]|nr:hypothetical protein [Spirochaetaceae bacterium]